MLQSVIVKKQAVLVAAVTFLLAVSFTGTSQQAWAAETAEGALSAGASVQSAVAPKLGMSDVSAQAGQSCNVAVGITGNPGILGATLEVSYDSRLTLTGIANGAAFDSLDMTKPGTLQSGCKIHWDAAELSDDDVKDGIVATLTFTVSKEAPVGAKCAISVSAATIGGQADVYDRKLETVSLQSARCTVTVAPTSLESAAIVSGLSPQTYTGKALKPSPTVKVGTKKLVKGTDYTLSYKGNTNVGTATVTVTGKGAYTGSKPATFKIVKAANTAVAKSTSVKKTLKAATLKKAAQTIALPKVTTKFGVAKWQVTTKDAKKVLSLSGSKVKVRKGAKSGTYAIKLKASVAKTKNYDAAATKVVTVKVTVK